jgi:hypothetical protein
MVTDGVPGKAPGSADSVTVKASVLVGPKDLQVVSPPTLHNTSLELLKVNINDSKSDNSHPLDLVMSA